MSGLKRPGGGGKQSAMARLFGTDGVRGVANRQLTPELATALGLAVAGYLRGEGRPGGPVLTGRDTRRSGPMLEAALAAGLAAGGVDVIRGGVLTTPAVAFLARARSLAAGAVVSASHNPAEYNGIKFFGGDGYKLPDAVEQQVEDVLGSGGAPRAEPCEVGFLRDEEGLAADYVGCLVRACPVRLEGLRVVLDCAHGAASGLAPRVFAEAGATVQVINAEPDGDNINRTCGALHPEGLADVVERTGADCGLAFDGDGDRCIAVDERGRVVDGDAILAVAALHLAARDRLPGRTVVATVMSNYGLEEALGRRGIRLERTPVGDRHVLERMRAGGFGLGGEQSGHIIFLEHATTGDGLLTGLQLLAIMKQEDRPLSELAAVMRRYPQLLVNVEAPRRHELEANRRVREAIAEVQRALAGKGRVLVRPSGTEPVVRVMVEGGDEQEVEELARGLAGVIRTELG